LILCFILVSIPENGVVKAEAQTIVVPDDYATIQEAIAVASEGDTIFVKKGTYEGPINQTLMINKTISIIGEDTENTVINLYPPYTVISMFPDPPFLVYSDAIVINANNVKLEGLTIVSTPGNRTVGDILVRGNSTQIIDCIITKGLTLTSSSNNITKNKIGYRFTLRNASSNTIVENTILTEYFYLRYSNSNVIHNNTCLGIAITGSGDTSSYNTFSRNIMNGENYRGPIVIAIGIYGTNNVFHDNYIANYNIPELDAGMGVSLSSSAVNNTFYRNAFINNAQNAGSSLSGNFWDNGVEGNYWDDYNGTDNNGDGIGDTPYIINENNQDNYPLMAPIKTFDAGTWEWTQYNVDIISNSTVSDFSFNPDEGAFMRFNVEGETGTTGFCRVTIPKDLLYAEDNWNVIVTETSVTPTVNVDTNNTYLYFTYKHSTNTIEIIGTTAIPEFPLWVILPLFLVATFVVVIIKKRLT
jgi:nitrous oxidase accessory protein